MLGYFVWKITILRQKIIFFPILGGARRVRPQYVFYGQAIKYTGARGTELPPPFLTCCLYMLFTIKFVYYFIYIRGRDRMVVGSWIYNYLCKQYLSPLMLWVRISISARCTTLCDKVCQWLATARWFSSQLPTTIRSRPRIYIIIPKYVFYGQAIKYTGARGTELPPPFLTCCL
jgi:hypothetical protein